MKTLCGLIIAMFVVPIFLNNVQELHHSKGSINAWGARQGKIPGFSETLAVKIDWHARLSFSIPKKMSVNQNETPVANNSNSEVENSSLNELREKFRKENANELNQIVKKEAAVELGQFLIKFLGNPDLRATPPYIDQLVGPIAALRDAILAES